MMQEVSTQGKSEEEVKNMITKDNFEKYRCVADCFCCVNLLSVHNHIEKSRFDFAFSCRFHVACLVHHLCA